MTEQTPDNKKNKADQSIPERSLPADIGKVEANAAVKEENPGSAKQTNVRESKKLSWINWIKRIWKLPAKWWNDLKSAEVSNRLIAIATVVISVATIFTWLDVHSGSKQTDKIIAASQDIKAALQTANGQNRDAVNRTLWQNQMTLNATVDQFHLDQRAWIGVEDISSNPPTPQVDKPWDISVTLKNTGKTPAKNILMRSAEATLKQLPDVNARCGEAVRINASSTLLPPNGTYRIILHVSNGVKVPIDWEKEISDAGKLYVSGCIVYDDVFRQKHWMTYCGDFEPPANGGPVNFLACKMHNDTGDGNPPH